VLPGTAGGYDLPENAIVLIANGRIVTNDLNQLDLLKPLARAIDVLDQDVALSSVPNAHSVVWEA
jgi:hypothetical protein